ncbi:MAG: pyruvate formate lyase-activating protein [Clostridiales bacterium]|nr:pyruvate formate lyase-activating protein [Clostridiales bacterium]
MQDQNEKKVGRIHSFQSLGTVDGPGIRFVAFLSGCNLRCKCCHNPDTWLIKEGKEYDAQSIVQKVLRQKEYFGNKGGITLSGGEPLLQASFCAEIFRLCKQKGVNTCLDTSGSIINEEVLELLDFTDRVLLDIKYTNDKDYLENVGCSLSSVLEFLKILDQKGIKTTIRQVIIPTKNDSEQNIIQLKRITSDYKCVDGIELLPFRKFCSVKYDNLKIEFPFANIPEPTTEKMQRLNNLLK